MSYFKGIFIILLSISLSLLPVFMALPNIKSYGVVHYSDNWGRLYVTVFFAKVNESFNIKGFPPSCNIVYGGMVDNRAVFNIQTYFFIHRTVYVSLNTPFYSGVSNRWFKPTLILPDQVNLVECDEYGQP